VGIKHKFNVGIALLLLCGANLNTIKDPEIKESLKSLNFGRESKLNEEVFLSEFDSNVKAFIRNSQNVVSQISSQINSLDLNEQMNTVRLSYLSLSKFLIQIQGYIDRINQLRMSVLREQILFFDEHICENIKDYNICGMLQDIQIQNIRILQSINRSNDRFISNVSDLLAAADYFKESTKRFFSDAILSLQQAIEKISTLEKTNILNRIGFNSNEIESIKNTNIKRSSVISKTIDSMQDYERMMAEVSDKIICSIKRSIF